MSLNAVYSAFKKVVVHFDLSLLPYFLRDVKSGVNKTLSNMLLKYDPSLRGVVIGWSDLHLTDVTKTAGLLWEYPDIHLKVGCTFLLFCPSIGMQLTGKVTSKGNDYISLLVFDVFQVQIHQKDVPHDSLPDVDVGSRLDFCVKNLETVKNILSITGSLNDTITTPKKSTKKPKTHKRKRSGALEKPAKKQKTES